MAERSARAGSSRSIFLNGLKSRWTIAALAMSLAFVSGSLIAIDSSQMAVVRGELEKIPVDFIARDQSTEPLTNEAYLDYRLPDIETFDGVQQIEPIVVLTHVVVTNSMGEFEPYYTGGYDAALFLSADSQRILDSYRIVGEMPDPGTVALPMQLADDLGVSIGDTVVLRFGVQGNEYTQMFQVSKIWTQEDFKEQIVYRSDGSSQQYLEVDENAVLFREYLNPVVLNIHDLYPLIDALGTGVLRDEYLDSSETLYLIWIDRGDYVDFSDTQGSVKALDVLYGPLSSRLASRGISVGRSELVWVLGPWNMGNIDPYRLRYVGLSIPVLALGAYVTVVGAGISADFRSERLLQQMYAQGVLRRTILKRLTLESVIAGLLAGVLGLVMGVVVSRALMGPVGDDVSGGLAVSVSMSDFAITWYTVLATLGLGVLFVVIASFFASLRATRYPRTGPSELDVLRELPFIEVLLIALSLVSVFAILGGQKWVGSHGFDWYFVTPGVFFDNIGLVLFPAMPFMLSVGIVSLLTRWPLSVQKRLRDSVSGRSQQLEMQLGALAERFEKRAHRMCVVVSLALAFGLAVTVAMDTAASRDEERLAQDSETLDLARFLRAELVALMVVVLVGVAMASYANSRMADSASLRAGGTGADRRSIGDALKSEAVMLVIIGAVVGISVGLFTAYLFGMMWVPGQDINEEFGVVLTLTVAVVVLASFASIVVASIIASSLGSRYSNFRITDH